MSVTITEHHNAKAAYIYVRQSTMGQVRFHRESTERQYALRDKAAELGWAPENIRVLDRDLGVSGAQMSGREDFKTLVADVSMGQVGAVFALEASRFARSNLEWHRLIELCALMGTLVIDADGCYDPADFNDGLLLGLKGTLAQAELHFLRARLQGGKLNKAKKGELRSPLPVGLCYDDEHHIILDPDQEVQGAVRSVFRFFDETGSGYGVVHRFAKLNLSFPKRSYGGVWDGKLVWGRLTDGRILSMLKNPRYAGAYVYGRRQAHRTVGADGEVQSQVQTMPIDAWRVNLKDHHEGYITWDDYLRNQQRLANNRTNGGPALSGPAREGLALLHGLLICGSCGRKLTARYRGHGGIYPTYECNWLRREGLATRACMSIRADLLDTAMAEQVLQILQPVQLELAVEALKHLEAREQSVTRQYQMRLERAEYDAQLAERRYLEVDPAQRLVAGTLEARWNEALERLEQLKQQHAERDHQDAYVATPEQKAKVLALASDFPRLWHAPTTQAKDRTRMLRLLIKDITVERHRGVKQAVLHVRWKGGACSDVQISIPANIADRVRYPAEKVEQIRTLARDHSDEQIATQLNQAGCRSPRGKVFTASMIQWVRYRYKIPKAQLKRADELTIKQLMERFGVSHHVVYYWIQRGLVDARQLKPGRPYWITLNPAKERKLQAWVKNSSRIPTANHSEIPL